MPKTPRALMFTVLLTCGVAVHARAVAGEAGTPVSVEDLSRLSLEALANVEVTSVSKAAQRLGSAPAAIYVIDRDEILRSGALSIPEILRLAPNLQVAQLTSTGYAITARGFGDKRDVQTQANKLLILVDGRSVYSPLFSGVFYDAIDVMIDDIERVEVISGPGATLWGANAMNGVINIITRSANDSQGLVARAGGGNSETAASVRLGSAREPLSYRIYAKAFDRGPLELASGNGASDGWQKQQAGFRLDWRGTADAVSVHADGYRADQDTLASDDVTISGLNSVVRWEHTTSRGALALQAYVDRVKREEPPEGADFTVNTYDLELQQRLDLGAHRWVFGAGKRFNDYDVRNDGPLLFLPAHRTLEQGNVFAQDVIALSRRVELTLGLKFEHNAYSGWSTLPDLRLSWAASDTALLWAAASRAVRAPTPFDTDVAEVVGGAVFLRGDPEFETEKVNAYELGYRGQPTSTFSFSASAFYDDYDDLRTVEITPVTLLPLVWGNRLRGNTYGLEAWANVQVTSWWRLSPGFRSLHKRLRFKDGASGLLGVEQAGNDPTSQALLKSSMDFGHTITFDATVRYVGELPDPVHADYYELSARLAWNVASNWQLSVSGANLLHSRHTEYSPPVGSFIERTFFAEARYRY